MGLTRSSSRRRWSPLSDSASSGSSAREREALPDKDSIKKSLEREFADLPDEYRRALPPFKEFYRASPTAECSNGTRGRTAVFEILRMNKNLEEVVLSEPVDEKIYAAALAGGMLTMREDAILKALSGEIPFEEINMLGGELFPEEGTA